MSTQEVYSETASIVLASMINYPGSLKKTLEMLVEDDFQEVNQRKIFRLIKETYTERKAVDLLLLAEHMKNKDPEFFKAIGGYPSLTELSSFVGTEVQIEAYCEEMRQSAVKRALLNIGRINAEELGTGTNPYVVLDRTGTKLRDLKANKPNADSTYRHLLDSISETDIIDEVRKTSPGANVGFKIGEIDLKIPGGAVTIVAGPTGHGKTLVLINFILTYLDLHKDKKAFFFSYEESRASILSLFLNTYINLDLSQNNRESIKSYFRDGETKYIYKEQQTSFEAKKSEFFKTLIETQRLNIAYSDYSAEELTQAIAFLKKNSQIGLVGIDYVQLLSLREKRTAQRQEELKEICKMLKDCAVNTGLPILIAAQFNRTVINEATMSVTAIGEAGDLERAANMVIGIWNRNFEGFGSEGNKGKNGKKIPKESAIYMEIFKGRETGTGHNSVFYLNGNTGKLDQRTKVKQVCF